ncbi:5-formyltetrahydrofolate cyclo-ligase [Patescibacteria group bacterium]|nr:5-formyltetrahydrofolate cyclo-ligase [Patescibacteria group bacterium]
MKDSLRLKLRERRSALSQSSYTEKSASIRGKLESLKEFKKSKKILLYVSTDEEVDTKALIKDCLKIGDSVFVPKVIKDSLAICKIDTWEDLKPGNFGILEPCEIISNIHPSEMDLIVVPGIGFDLKGHRIGYGKGFYDRLLKQTNGFKVGLAFEEQILHCIPSKEHDVPLDLIITDKHIFRF